MFVCQSVLIYKRCHEGSRKHPWKGLATLMMRRFPLAVRTPDDLADRWGWVKAKLNPHTRTFVFILTAPCGRM